jgi:hypothetical protein
MKTNDILTFSCPPVFMREISSLNKNTKAAYKE